MAIEFVQEDGTGKADATSYASFTQYQQYWLNRGETITDTEAIVQGLLNLATEYIDNTYRFKGTPSDVTVQALKWPRINLENSYYAEYDTPDFDEVPVELINATCWLAKESKKGTLNLVNESISSETLGPVQKSYGRHSGYTSYPIVEKMLRNYLISGTPVQRVG